MKDLYTIQKLYSPLQPSVRKHADVLYEEITPAENLRPFIYCYWRLSTIDPLPESYSYKVVADGCIDIFFETSSPENASVMGFCRNYIAFDLGHSFNYIGIRFLPTMFSHLFKVDAHTLLNQVRPLIDISESTLAYISKTSLSPINLTHLAEGFNDHFIELVGACKFDIDYRLYDAIQLIYDQKGQVNLSKDINTGISQRQLRRLFQYYIGDTAKAFSKVVRFQHMLASIRNLDHLKSDRIYLDNGYYDQAHFIKDFRNFYGVTPSVAFG